jgi:ribosome-associated toxin RatA of RatAB toxin-antitoxin module
MPAVTREKTMPVSCEALYQAITKFEEYPEFLSEVTSAKTLSKKNNKVIVDFELEVVKKFRYQLEFNLSVKDQVSWKLVESDFFKLNQGAWVLKSKTPTSTEVRYQVEVETGLFIPGFVAKKLTEVSLPKLLENFETRARKWERKS